MKKGTNSEKTVARVIFMTKLIEWLIVFTIIFMIIVFARLQWLFYTGRNFSLVHQMIPILNLPLQHAAPDFQTNTSQMLLSLLIIMAITICVIGLRLLHTIQGLLKAIKADISFRPTVDSLQHLIKPQVALLYLEVAATIITVLFGQLSIEPLLLLFQAGFLSMTLIAVQILKRSRF